MARIRFAVCLTVLTAAVPALAQDIPGIEICTAEKTMERRTGCLQSNIDFLKQTITKATLDYQQRLDAANRQIEVLKAAVAGLQVKVDQLQAKETLKDSSKTDKPKDVPAK
jgi:hypothetical protein